MSNTDKNAILKVKLVADSGYISEEEIRISPNQWGEINKILHPQANGDNSESKALHIDSVSHRIDFEKLRQDYFNECVDKTNGKSKLYVCLAPHYLFEWFRKELLEYSG